MYVCMFWLRGAVFSGGRFSLARRLISAVRRAKSKISKNPKIGRISKNKLQQVCKLINTYLQAENEGGLGFRLWPPLSRFSCALALKDFSFLHDISGGSFNISRSNGWFQGVLILRLGNTGWHGVKKGRISHFLVLL